MDRVIIHSDANCFYASVEMLYHPEFAGKPLAVGGDPEARHGIVLTANYIAKKHGVKTGMALWQARQACPDVIFVPPRMDLYLKFSSMLREIYGDTVHYIDPDQGTENLDALLEEETADPAPVLEKYSWDRAADKWLALIRERLAEGIL